MYKRGLTMKDILADRTNRIDASGIRKVFALAASMTDPINFAIGQPDFEVPEEIKQAAIDAIRSAARPHWFLGIDEAGSTAVISTTGNPDTHLILRGGSDGANYGAEEIDAAVQRLRGAELPARLLVDCSHANSGKTHRRQAVVWRNLIAQIEDTALRERLRTGRQLYRNRLP